MASAFRMKAFFTALLILAMASALAAPDTGLLGHRFFRVAFTLNEKPLLTASIFEGSDGHFIVKGAPLAQLIARAYGVQPYQVVDAPEWVYQTHLYDIDAEPPPAELVVSDDTRMLQTLLGERFALQMRRETRGVTLLVLERDFPRQQLASQIDCNEEARRAVVQARIVRRDGLIAGPELALRAMSCISVQALVTMLARVIGEPIHDLTAAAGAYLAAPVRVRPDSGHDLLSVYAESLALSGLMLERRTVDMEVLVVTAIEHPTLDPLDK